jgi:AbiV family abortive infection protein
VTHKTENTSARTRAVAEVIANVKRLITDAELLLSRGSPGSSLSLAILAFEEAGKGHIIELALNKPKVVHSHHEFRHFVALFVLSASLNQKYQLDMKAVSAKIQARLQNEMVKPKGKLSLPPMDDALRAELRAEIIPQFQKMNHEEFQSFMIESRWMSKIAAIVQNGGLEKLRQSGLYIDTHPDFSIASSPMSLEPLEAQRWIWAAGRVLNLLESGTFYQPYSPLSELIAAAASGDDKAAEVLEIFKSRASDSSA